MASPIAVAMATDASARQRQRLSDETLWLRTAGILREAKSFVGTTSTTAPCELHQPAHQALAQRERTDRPPVALPTTI